MTKRISSKHKIDRRLKINLWGRPKSPFNTRAYGPGQHGQSRRSKLSNYGVQLQEKQKIKFTYGLLEKQFHSNFEKAEKMVGETGINMLQLLEKRLDNVVYKLGFAPSRPSSRQLITHKHFLVNNKVVNIPSYKVKPGDIIQVREKSKKLDIIIESLRRIKGDIDLSWLEINKAKMRGVFLSVPERDEMKLTFNEQLVVELYSK